MNEEQETTTSDAATCDNCQWLIYDTDRMGAPVGAHCDNRRVPNVRWYGECADVDDFGCNKFVRQPAPDDGDQKGGA